MGVYKIVYRCAVGLLLAAALSACLFEQTIEFIVDPKSGALVGIRTPVTWKVNSPEEFVFFDAGSVRQDIGLANAVFTGSGGCCVEITVSDGVDTGFSGLFGIFVMHNGSDSSISKSSIRVGFPAAVQSNVTDFVQDFSILGFAKQAVFTPELMGIDVISCYLPVIVEVRTRYNDVVLAEAKAVYPTWRCDDQVRHLPLDSG